MPSPTRSMLHVEQPLANMSIAYMQSTSQFVFNQVFPICRVEKENDKYYVFDLETFLRGRARRRADGTESAGGGYKLSTDSYDLGDPFAFHKDVTERERRNADSMLGVDRNAVNFVTQNILITAEEEWVAKYFQPNIWGVTKVGGTHVGRWDQYNDSDPVTDIATGRLWIWQNTGYKPNRMTVHPTVHERLKNHPLILDRTEGEVVDETVLAKLFEVEKYLIAGAVHRTGPDGNGGTGSFIAGRNVLLSYAPNAPAREMPSCGYTFALNTKPIDGIEKGVKFARIPMDQLGVGTQRIEGELFINGKVTGVPLGYFFSDIVEEAT